MGHAAIPAEREFIGEHAFDNRSVGSRRAPQRQHAVEPEPVDRLTHATLLDPPYPTNVIEQLGTEYQRWPVTGDVAERLAESSWLEAGPIESVSIDGIEASAFDYRVLDLDEALFTDEEGYVGVYAFDLPGEWHYGSHDGEAGRFWIVPLDADDVLLIDAYATADGDAEEFLAIAGAVVESMRFG